MAGVKHPPRCTGTNPSQPELHTLRARQRLGLPAQLGVPTIEAVLLYHVAPGATITSAQALKANGAHLKTAQGGTFRVKVYAGPTIELVDADKYMTNAKVVLSQVDINKGNKQIAHGIDRVMLPLPLKPVA